MHQPLTAAATAVLQLLVTYAANNEGRHQFF
jgi:hypothetical protein